MNHYNYLALILNRIENCFISMNKITKLIIGIIITLAGLARYILGWAFAQYIGMSSLQALSVIIVGSIVVLLILVGLVVMGIG
jgi:hypothetical protein